MATLDRVVPPRALRVSTAVTVITAGWFALTFAVTVGAMVVGV